MTTKNTPQETVINQRFNPHIHTPTQGNIRINRKKQTLSGTIDAGDKIEVIRFTY